MAEVEPQRPALDGEDDEPGEDAPGSRRRAGLVAAGHRGHRRRDRADVDDGGVLVGPGGERGGGEKGGEEDPARHDFGAMSPSKMCVITLPFPSRM